MKSVEEGAKIISDCFVARLGTTEGALIGRFGTIEFECLETLEHRLSLGDHQSQILERHAGVFPAESWSQEEWALQTKRAFQAADILATGWYAPIKDREQSLLHNRWGWQGPEIPLRSLEPYYVAAEDRWTRHLRGQKVCVITSFTQSAKSQVQKGESLVWPGANGSLWPEEVKWSWVQTGYAPVLAMGRGGWEGSPESWEEAVETAVAQALATEAKVILIGCGGLGMIIGHRLKKAGRICIVMGGAIQVLFGVKGERWRNHSFIHKLWRDSWVWPQREETPGGAESIEGGCYWGIRN